MERATRAIHTTSRGESRLLVRYESKPGRATMQVLRKFGRYRQGNSGQSPAWYLTCDAHTLRTSAAGCPSLLRALDALEQPPPSKRQRREECPACAWEHGHPPSETAPDAHTMTGTCWFKA